MAPQLVAIFWAEVEDRLVNDFHVGRSEARLAVTSYRKQIESPQTGDAVYNRGTEQIAQLLADTLLVR